MIEEKCGLHINRASRELKAHGTTEFPCAGYNSIYSIEEDQEFPWHWHEELEIVHAHDGDIHIKIPQKDFHLKKGDYLIINSNVPHYVLTDEYCNLQSFVFHERLITGGNDTVFSKKYIAPLLSEDTFSAYYVKNKKIAVQFASCFGTAFHYIKNDLPGYEFVVRENLSKILFLLFQELEENIKTSFTEKSIDQQRILEMLSYIHAHFSEDITLSDISKTVGIGERECLRCFKKCIQISPVQYLLKYRIMQGAEMLIQKPSSSIAEIALACGFDSPSNFSKMFKRFYQCTPREYRNKL